MNGSIKAVNLFWVQLPKDRYELSLNVIRKHIVFHLRGLLNVIIAGLQYLEDELKGLLIYVRDDDLCYATITFPFSRASASET